MQPDPTPALTDEMRAEGWDVYRTCDVPNGWQELVEGEACDIGPRHERDLLTEPAIARRKPVTVEVPLDLLKRAARCAGDAWAITPTGSDDEQTALVRDLRAAIEQAEADQ